MNCSHVSFQEKALAGVSNCVDAMDSFANGQVTRDPSEVNSIVSSMISAISNVQSAALKDTKSKGAKEKDEQEDEQEDMLKESSIGNKVQYCNFYLAFLKK